MDFQVELNIVCSNGVSICYLEDGCGNGRPMRFLSLSSQMSEVSVKESELLIIPELASKVIYEGTSCALWNGSSRSTQPTGLVETEGLHVWKRE